VERHRAPLAGSFERCESHSEFYILAA
jgi:hypothetical protein